MGGLVGVGWNGTHAHAHTHHACLALGCVCSFSLPLTRARERCPPRAPVVAPDDKLLRTLLAFVMIEPRQIAAADVPAGREKERKGKERNGGW